MRALLVVGTLALLGLTAQSTAPVVGRTVPCTEIIDRTTFPFVGSHDPRYQYRQVLDALSVPEAYLEQIVPTGERPWAYWRKAGIVVRAGAGPVTITVPSRWRRRAAIVWGNGGHGPFRSLRIARCAGDSSIGLAYAGGFLLRARSACLPLIFRVGDRSATVRFGLGRRCPTGG